MADGGRMEIGIVLDGEGRLGSPSAITSVARAADRLGYGSLWCIGPWAPTLVGAVAVVTARVRIGIEATQAPAVASARTAAGDRLTVVDRLPLWPPAAGSALVRLDVGAGDVATSADRLRRAQELGVGEVVVRLVGGRDLDEALADYAELAERVEALAARPD